MALEISSTTWEGEENRTHNVGTVEQKACGGCQSTQDTKLTINELDLHKSPKFLNAGWLEGPWDTILG